MTHPMDSSNPAKVESHGSEERCSSLFSERGSDSMVFGTAGATAPTALTHLSVW